MASPNGGEQDETSTPRNSADNLEGSGRNL